ncbi:MAG: hemolysin III [Saliniramus fredricksonii]|uniref:Hemolysin III n=1 Tax=Saliniramus fredricksonii TaxID=1653334 RepID=A0A0P8BHQ1_9HYPH|nr:hemolysin III family protein [Saliniramus fredricksonii]KPQ08676.1 MAG: hemolysin III [Saliniramus fredricksonii]SCC81186.1 hemolysin III [Saliniramus fredricksonii]
MRSAFTPPASVRWTHDRAELWADGAVHVAGLVAALIGVAFLMSVAAPGAETALAIALGIYAAGLVAVKAISALYNMWPASRVKWVLRRFDHAAIYLLIAGTYTPFLVLLDDRGSATILLAVIWLIAVIGGALKIGLPGRFDRLSIILYLGLGWSGLAAGGVVYQSLSATTLTLIAAGGIVYSTGVIFHLWKGLRFHNAIWHVFVLAGSALFYAAIWDATLARAAA